MISTVGLKQFAPYYFVNSQRVDIQSLLFFLDDDYKMALPPLLLPTGVKKSRFSIIDYIMKLINTGDLSKLGKTNI